jgi:plastocyanin
LYCSLLAACGDDDNETPVSPAGTLNSVTVTAASASVAAGSTTTLTSTALDGNRTALSGATFAYASSAPSIAEVAADGAVLGLSAGTSTITVTATLGGVTKTATVPVTVTGSLPVSASITGGVGGLVFTPPTFVLARGGSITWTWGAFAHNVTFASTVGAPAAIPTATNVSASRTFATAGNFDYQCTLHQGMTGRVIVR